MPDEMLEQMLKDVCDAVKRHHVEYCKSPKYCSWQMLDKDYNIHCGYTRLQQEIKENKTLGDLEKEKI